MVYKCKICGGQTTVDRQNGIAVCDYCGTKQVLPLFTEDSARLLYERGNNYLLQNEYDKAESVFSQLLTITPKDPELYWNLILCKYGVTYVKDPKTAKYIPTCNRTHYTSIFKDENYLKVMDLSSGEQKALYKSDAETIDNIQKGILAVSKKEKPFDIFISYKETDATGGRTKDSIAAQDLYEKLTEAGYKVFFSRITLEDKIGTEYEPYIYAALYSSKVMLTVCSSKENVEAVWVKNEWSRFLTLRQADTTKTLIPLYFDMPKSELPDEFAMLSKFNLEDEGFEKELLRGIKKLIPLPIMLAQKRKKARKTMKIVAACFSAVAIVGAAFGVTYAMQNARYVEATKLFESAQYEEASVIFGELEGFKDSKVMVEKCAIQPDYDQAMKYYYDGDYAQSTWAFEKLGDYEDSAEMKEMAELSWRKSLANVYAEDHDIYSESIYYINDNGTVEGVDGSDHENLVLEKHGKIISIEAADGPLYALHEDGYVSNAPDDSDKWQDVVKISRKLSETSIALRADGTMIYGSLEGGDEYNDDSWLESLSEWKDVVDFELYYPHDLQYGSSEAAVIGIKADGTLYVACRSYLRDEYNWVTDEGFNEASVQKVIEKFSNVKALTFTVGTSKKVEDVPFEIVAITKDGKKQVYHEGKFTESKCEDVCDIAGRFLLKTNGDVVDENGKIKASDIVQLINFDGGSYAVAMSRMGTVYFGYDFSKAEVKVVVYDEWVRRLS